MTRQLVTGLLLASLLVACGRYGPPVRPKTHPTASPTASPAAANPLEAPDDDEEERDE